MTKTARTTTISVRIDKPTAVEWREKAEAADLSLSDWIRGAIDANQQTHLPTPRKRAVRVRDTSHDADPVLMRQLGVVRRNRRNFRHPGALAIVTLWVCGFCGLRGEVSG